MYEQVLGGAVERVGDRGGMAHRDRQRPEQTKILPLRDPQPEIRVGEGTSCQFEQRRHCRVSDEEFIAVECVRRKCAVSGQVVRVTVPKNCTFSGPTRPSMAIRTVLATGVATRIDEERRGPR